MLIFGIATTKRQKIAREIKTLKKTKPMTREIVSKIKDLQDKFFDNNNDQSETSSVFNNSENLNTLQVDLEKLKKVKPDEKSLDNHSYYD